MASKDLFKVKDTPMTTVGGSNYDDVSDYSVRKVIYSRAVHYNIKLRGCNICNIRGCIVCKRLQSCNNADRTAVEMGCYRRSYRLWHVHRHQYRRPNHLCHYFK